MTRIRLALLSLVAIACTPVPALAAETPSWAAPILDPLLTAVGLAFAALVSWLAAEAIRWLRAHVTSVQTYRGLTLLTEATELGVQEVARTFVDELKSAAADGKLTSDEAATARARATLRARDLLGTEGLAAVKAALGGADQAAIEAWIVAKVEQAVTAAKARK
jgi:hypothetical protein